MDYQIKNCTSGDLDRLIILCGQHAMYEHTTYNGEGKLGKLHVALFSGDKHLNCIVAEVAGKVIGYASYTFEFSTWDAENYIHLDCLYLEEAYRSFGIGQVLLEKVKAIGQEAKCINMQWQTPSFNTNAIRFYKRIGGIGKQKVRFKLNLKC